MPAGAQCAGGRDGNGSYYFIAKPSNWNGELVVYAHGGPSYNVEPSLDQILSLANAASVAIHLTAGYGLALPSYRDQYWHLDDYAEDMEYARRAFVSRFGVPRRTLLEGVSFGGPVGAKTIERYKHSYDGALLVAGVMAGSLLDTELRFDSRVVYQYYCHNLPLPGEPQYPLWRGWIGELRLPRTVDSMFASTFPEMIPRMRECTGFDLPDSLRTPRQRRNYRNIASVTHVDSVDFRARLGFAAMLYTIQAVMSGGKNVFDNRHAVYTGSDDDEALNRGVVRYDADTAAARRFFEMTTPAGSIEVPVLTSHSINDPRIPVEEESYYGRVVERAGRGQLLSQVYTGRHDHPGTSPFEVIALLHALDQWVATGARPTPASVIAECERAKPAGSECTFLGRYAPNPLSSIIPPQGRERILPTAW